MNRRKSILVGVGLVVAAIGVWIILVPFPRPVPGIALDTLHITPEAHCGSGLLEAVRGDSTATALVYADEVAREGDPQEEVTVDCSGPARARVAIGIAVVAIGAAVTVRARQSKVDV